jgi:hypothetical protein
VAGRIYWTRKKVTLYAGETLLSDDTHLARTRCGNRISEVPAEPTSPSEPPSEVLSPPVSPRLPINPPAPEAPLWANEYPPFPLGPGYTPSPRRRCSTRAALSTSPLLRWLVGPHSPGRAALKPATATRIGPFTPLPSPLPQPFPGPLPPPVATPEPRSGVLLGIGLAGLLFLWKFRRS